jgi:hypothetical protein
MITKAISYFTILSLLFINTIAAQVKGNESSKQKFTLSGTITDTKSNETVIGVNVYIAELKTGTTSNEYGFYSITIPTGTYSVQFSAMGFETTEERIVLDKNIKNNFKLTASEEQLKDFTKQILNCICMKLVILAYNLIIIPL